MTDEQSDFKNMVPIAILFMWVAFGIFAALEIAKYSIAFWITLVAVIAGVPSVEVTL